MIRKHGGSRLEKYYANTLEMLEAHYGEISLLDLPRVPWGAWKNSQYRKQAVREAVKRLGKRPERVRVEDFCRIGLEGLIVNGGLGIKELMREAGFDVADHVSWQSRKERVNRIRELVEKTGGPGRITFTYIKKRARGLIEYYTDCGLRIADCGMGEERRRDSDCGLRSGDCGTEAGEAGGSEAASLVNRHWAADISKLPDGLPIQKGLPGEYIPALYWILKDAGYAVTPDDCLRGLDALEEVASLHGHRNHSLAEALADDWIYDIVGKNHMHDVIYPGQRKSRRYEGKDCDFVLFPAEARKTPGRTAKDTRHSPPATRPSSSLWIEYAGLWSERKNRFARKYKRKIQTKKALAKKEGIHLVVLTPANMKKPENVWDEMVSKAPWLKKKKKAAMGSRFLERLAGGDRRI